MLGVKSYRDQHGNLILCNLQLWPLISNDNVIFCDTRISRFMVYLF